MRRQPGHCNPANPRIIQQTYIDHPDCTCKACDQKWTSDGGPPRVAFCYPEVIPRYFKLEVKLSTPMERRSYDYTPFATAKMLMDAVAQSAVQSSLGNYANVTRHGAVQREDLDLPPTDASYFTTIYTFNGTAENLQDLLELLNTCGPALQTPLYCDIFLQIPNISPSTTLLGFFAADLGFSSSTGRKPARVSKYLRQL